jgi:predicted amidohydrolase YtcJ
MKTTAADRVLLSGNIYTVDQNFSTAQAIAIKDGKIIYVGNDEGAREFTGESTEVIPLEGKTVVPGLMEGHLHLQSYGESLLWLRIRDKSKEEILSLVKEAISQLSPGAWLIGGSGWNNEVWDDPSYPTKEELDAVAPDNPVFLPRMDGHLCWVNSAAFRAAGVDESTPNPQGGEFMRRPDGSLLGCAGNAAQMIIRQAIPKPDKEARLRALMAAQDQMLQYGLTSINEMATPFETIGDIKELLEAGKFKLRYHGALRDASGKNARQETRDYFLSESPEIGLYDDHFTIRAIKILGDGAVGSQSAALFEEYTDRPGHTGTLMQTDEEIYEIIKEALERGMQVITHAIGDRAIDQILTAYERADSEYPDRDHRFRIEHFQLITGNSSERARDLGVVVSMQPLHGPNSASMALRRLGPDRSARAYAIGMAHRVVGRFVAGSDAPVAQPDPIAGIHAAINRTNQQLLPEGGFFMDNAVSRADALRAYTIWSAYGQFCEDKKGSIEPGKLADLTILDKDILKVADHEILDVKVLETIIGGKTEYKA